MRLFIVGQSSPNPDDWYTSEIFSIVLAETAADAIRLSDGFGGEVVTEIPTDEPRVVFVHIPWLA